MTRLGAISAIWLWVLSGDAVAQITTDIDRIVATPSSFEGKQVTVNAYLKFGDDQHALFQSRDVYQSLDTAAADDPEWKLCVTIWNYGSWRKRLMGLADRNVTVTGTVRTVARKPGEIHWDCSDTGIEIEKIR